MKAQDEIYSNLIWATYSNNDNFEKLKFKLNKIRQIMMKQHGAFCRLSAQNQFDFAVTICCIATQTSIKDLRQFRMTGDKNEVFPYSLDEGYIEPDVINIDNFPNPKLLLDKKKE